MKKEEIVFQLTSIGRRISFMKDSEIEREVKEDVYLAKFDNFSFVKNEEGKSIRYRTSIRIEKTFEDMKLS